MGGEPVQAQVVLDQQAWGEEGAGTPVQGVVDPGLDGCSKELVGMEESDGVTGTNSRKS